MRSKAPISGAVAAASVLLALGAGAPPAQAARARTILACYNTRSGKHRTVGALRIRRPGQRRSKGEPAVSRDTVGPAGKCGPRGMTGATGQTAPRSATGPASTKLITATKVSNTNGEKAGATVGPAEADCGSGEVLVGGAAKPSAPTAPTEPRLALVESRPEEVGGAPRKWVAKAVAVTNGEAGSTLELLADALCAP